MKSLDRGEPHDVDLEITALIASLHRTGARLEELTRGEVDAVADLAGRTFVLQRAQELLRDGQAHKQAAILNALPANIALLDAHGIIVSVNDAWLAFGAANNLQAPGAGIGDDYLAACQGAVGDDAATGAEAARGIRAVISGAVAAFSIEYACDSPAEHRWFLMKVAPVPAGHSNGAVVMHIDISAQRRSREELELAHQRLMRTSRQAGMAEVATNILHNVGNVLNSVNVSASLAAESVRATRAGGLAEVVALLRRHEGDLDRFTATDPKGRHVVDMLGELSRDWTRQQEALEAELCSLKANVDHIKRIVSVQQAYAKVSGVAEWVDLRDILEDSLRMNADPAGDAGLRIVRDFQDVAPIMLEKHKALQIVVNLVRNAQHACAGMEGERRITLGIAEAVGQVRITVADTGSGIAPENLQRIFAHGFTTRRDGHGFGLHSGALDAAALGGSLGAQSDGPGRGAVFTLVLPATRGEPVVA